LIWMLRREQISEAVNFNLDVEKGNRSVRQ
jgi:hypothetical protein